MEKNNLAEFDSAILDVLLGKMVDAAIHNPQLAQVLLAAYEGHDPERFDQDVRAAHDFMENMKAFHTVIDPYDDGGFLDIAIQQAAAQLRQTTTPPSPPPGDVVG